MTRPYRGVGERPEDEHLDPCLISDGYLSVYPSVESAGNKTVIRVSDVGVIRRLPVHTGKMSDDLRSRLNEIETTVDALTDEVVELQQRLDDIEGGDEEPSEEVGIGADDDKEEETDDDVDGDIRVA